MQLYGFELMDADDLLLARVWVNFTTPEHSLLPLIKVFTDNLKYIELFLAMTVVDLQPFLF